MGFRSGSGTKAENPEPWPRAAGRGRQEQPEGARSRQAPPEGASGRQRIPRKPPTSGTTAPAHKKKWALEGTRLSQRPCTSATTAPAHKNERANAKAKKNKKVTKMGKGQNTCVFSVKVARAVLARTRERRDPHRSRYGRTKVRGASAAQEGRRQRIRWKRVARRHFHQAPFTVKNK